MITKVATEALEPLVEAGCLSRGSVDWVLSSGEPYAVWHLLTALFGLPAADTDVAEAHDAVVRDQAVQRLLATLEGDGLALDAGHHGSQFAANRLRLLADMGLGPGDDWRLDAAIEAIARRFDARGRYLGARSAAGRRQPVDSCEANAFIEVLLRYGLSDRRPVASAARRVSRRVRQTAQGRAWSCTVESRPLVAPFGRPSNACPQITLEGLRALALVDAGRSASHNVARAPLVMWQRRMEERPHEFGHGYQFKTVRWPSFWYDALSVAEALGHFPDLWGAEAPAEDRAAMAEIVACLVAYNLDASGKVVPKRVHRGFEGFSFGRKAGPSPFATARLLAVLSRFGPIAEDIAAVDVDALPSSRGGTERAVPPGVDAPAIPECGPGVKATYRPERILPRVLARQHLDIAWEPQSPESVTSDIVGLPAGLPTTPYLSLAARMRSFTPTALDQALGQRRSLVMVRGMRGQLYAVRRDFVSVVHAASVRQVVKHAREFATRRGVEPHDYERLSRQVMTETAVEPLTLKELSQRISTHADLGAVLTLMLAEKTLLAVPAGGDRFGRQRCYMPFSVALPEVDLAAHTEDEARTLLLRAYARGFGPVTHRDAAWWTGMDLKRVQRAFERLEDELVEVSFHGRDGTWLMHAADAEELERATLMESPNVAVLPANDPLLAGYANRSTFIPDEARPYVFDAAGNAAPVVLYNGRVVAVWDCHVPEQGTAEFLVFATAPIDEDAVERLRSRAGHAMSVRFPGHRTTMRSVTGMRPLAGRTTGAFRHPLR